MLDADLCQDHKHVRSDEDQKTATLGGILSEEIHKTPGKRLAGDDCDATARPLPRGASRATARPAPAKAPPPFACSCPPNQLGRHLRGNMQLPGQISKHLHGGMQIFMKALPPRHLSCLPTYMALPASLAWARVEARRGGDGRDRPRSRPR